VLVGVALIATVASGSGCKPKLDELVPRSGQPGTVVEVKGDDLLLATVQWDANTASEETIPSGFFVANFFTVPITAQTGEYPVRLLRGSEYSDNAIVFVVTAGLERQPPRLEDVTVYRFTIDPATETASMFLMAHGANIDVGSKIHVNGGAMPTLFYKLLRNMNRCATDSSTLGYPVFHYATVLCPLENQELGSEISVEVENLDGQKSDKLLYKIAVSAEELDSDGDGLPDLWETEGYDDDGDGSPEVDLPALGADPYRKDLFIEVDWMVGCEPNSAIWDPIESAFKNAPVLNPDGSHGISAHIDRGGSSGTRGGQLVDYAESIGYETAEDLKLHPHADYVKFHDIKDGYYDEESGDRYFDPERLKIYRYCVFAWDHYDSGTSGQAEDTLSNDFFVSLGPYGADGKRADWQTGVFMHELGHTLGLMHGGLDDENSKENYNSVMQYGNETEWWDGLLNRFSPSMLGGIDTNCYLFDVDGVYTYSQGQRRMLDESDLNEFEGVCDHVNVLWYTTTWNGDSVLDESVAVDLGKNDELNEIRDFADWADIELNFRAPGTKWSEN
jgi:hypothetical protein